MEEALARDVPGRVYAFSQPIELRVAELVAGVKTDVGISVYGGDLDALRLTAEQVAAAVSGVPGSADVAVEQGGLPHLRSSPATSGAGTSPGSWRPPGRR